MRRVVVTGVGVLSSIGNTLTQFEESLRACRPGIGPITQIDTSRLRFHNAAEVAGFEPTGHFTDSQLNWLDRFAQLGIVAARDAIADSTLTWNDELRARTGVITGSCVGGQTTQDEAFAHLYLGRRSRLVPLTVPRVMANAGASHISMEFGITGPTFTVSTACSSANHAIGQALWLIRQGTLDCALAGGSEAPISFGHLKAWEAMRVVAPDTCRPFSKNRAGIILGEGAAMLVLETLENARARGAKIYAELAGFGMSADAYHLTSPLAEGAARAMNAALEDGHLSPEQINYVNAHGTGTQANDSTETRAIRQVFGSHADRLAVSSTKSMHGHALGAAGALEGVATLLAFRNNFLPPTANFLDRDPACDLDVVPNEARSAEIEAALSNSFAFGGLNAVLAFRRVAE